MIRLLTAISVALTLAGCGGDDPVLTATASPSPTVSATPSPSPSPSLSPSPSPVAVPSATPPPTPEPEPVPEPRIVTVDVVEFAFEPADASINAGDTVTWTNQGSVTHTVTFSGGGPDSGNLSSGDTFEAIFDQAGSFSYRCVFHGRMTGTITVG